MMPLSAPLFSEAEPWLVASGVRILGLSYMLWKMCAKNWKILRTHSLCWVEYFVQIKQPFGHTSGSEVCAPIWFPNRTDEKKNIYQSYFGMRNFKMIFRSRRFFLSGDVSAACATYADPPKCHVRSAASMSENAFLVFLHRCSFPPQHSRRLCWKPRHNARAPRYAERGKRWLTCIRQNHPLKTGSFSAWHQMKGAYKVNLRVVSYLQAVLRAAWVI